MSGKVEWIDFDVRIPNSHGVQVKTVPIKVPAIWSVNLQQWILTGEAIRIIELTKASHVEQLAMENN